jgi:NADH-quinone oxidoreductase subunit N
MQALLAATDIAWKSPTLDYHALAPEIVLGGVLCVLLIAEMFLEERQKWLTSTVAGLGLLATLVPLLSLALDDGPARSMFGGGYVVDDFSLVLKALFCIAAYVVVLLSTTYVDEGGYYQGEYYFLLLTSVLGMMMMSSSRELVSMFVALEFLSIPAYMLAAWRKRDAKSNEAGVKYFLLGVFSSAVMLYGMSLLYGETGSTNFAAISAKVTDAGLSPILTLSIVFIIIGFAFKVSAVPFHTWAPDTYEGAPTPITAFLSVASKAAGFVALLTLVVSAFPDAKAVWQPFFWVLAAATMTLGNLTALKQTNIVRMLAYSSIAQGGFILMPLAVIGRNNDAFTDAVTAIVTYLIVYAAMNLGAFAVVLAVSRKTRSGEIASYGGLFSYAPGLTIAMTIFLVSLGGIPPVGGWVAKFYVFKALIAADNSWAVVLAVIGVVNSVVALFYYLNVARQMWFMPTPDGDTSPIRIPAPLVSALVICAVATVAIGVVPGIVLHFGDLATFANATR